MNESLFSCYDSLFCAGSLQQFELQQTIADNDLQGSSLLFDGQTEVSIQHLKQQQSFQENSSSAVSSPQNRDDVGLIVAPTLNNVNNSVTYDNLHKNIPFVQIHTTNVQPQRSNYGNVFRRAVSNHAEIKSEPIKSEAADSSKDRVNATPTPPVKNVSCNSIERNASLSIPPIEVTEIDDAGVAIVDPSQETSDETSMLEIELGYDSLRKCKECRFICLDGGVLEQHMMKDHSINSFNGVMSETVNKEMPCPGCSNVFFAYKSLQIHLIEDHFTSEGDAKKLANLVRQSVQNNRKISQLESTKVQKADDSPAQERKSRIYLKNVECLREPRREPLESDGAHHNHVSDGFFQTNAFNNLERHIDLSSILNSDFSDVDTQVNVEEKQDSHRDNSSSADLNQDSILDNRPKQKISIKSVDVLREPALLRRDYNMQDQFCNMTNNRNELNFDSFNGFQPPASVGNNNNDLCSVPMNDEIGNNDTSLEKSRRPKIYIKNVDILKEPIMLPPFASNTGLGLQDANSNLNYNYLAQAVTNSDFINNPSTIGVTNQVYDADRIGQLPINATNISDSFLYDNVNNGHKHVNNSSNNGNGLLTDLSGANGTDGFQSFGNSNSTVNTSFLTYPIINCIGIDSSDHIISTTPIITEPTPPPVPVFPMQSTEDTSCNSVESIPVSTPPKQKQKIFIKNVDILKEPQFQEQRERGTLHLRTVDELNLMNRNEVESLIAPNLENNNMNSSSSSFTNHSEDHTQMPEEDDALRQDMFYEDNPLKLQDYATQLVNNWSADDYDLGEEIDCIITDSMDPITNVQATLPPLSPCVSNAANLQKMIHELDTPQISTISIRDFEELTGSQHLQQQSTFINNLPSMGACTPSNTHTAIASNEPHTHQYDGNGIRQSLNILNIMEDETQKPCISSTLGDNNQKTSVEKVEHITTITSAATTSVASSFNFNLSVTLPPLMPVNSFSLSNKSGPRENTTTTSSIGVTPLVSTIPIPPLVPVPSLVPFTTSSTTMKSIHATNTLTPSVLNTTATATAMVTTTTTTTTMTTTSTSTSNANHAERGRIYVANNLLQKPVPKKDATVSSAQKPTSLSVTGGTSVRGRPFGSNRSDTANKARSEFGEVVLKCTVRGCAFRFKKPETLDYHRRCHDSSASSLQAKICPECKSTDFGNWNTLHTHLWRSHQIDMELYSCSQCPFKTPIYSRLVNTHTKIHSEERNYKCEQCGKAFKNTKQLKNHRRWHRTHGNVGNSNSITTTKTDNTISDKGIIINGTSVITADLHRCGHCDAAFSHLKSLREHSCKNSNKQLLCNVCGHIASSKSSLKLHIFTHENSKRLKCSSCTYSTNDHNAFRRHKMTHENTKMYICPHCSYKSIQSVTFQKHVLLKHPDSASTLIHKCKLCSYSTVNRTLFALHQIRHKPDPVQTNSSIECIEDETISVDKDLSNSANKQINNKIINNNNNLNKNNANNAVSTDTIQHKPATVLWKSELEKKLNTAASVNNYDNR